MKFNRLVLPILIASILFAQHIPSNERGDANYRRQTNIDGNKVRTSIFNYGVTGRPEAGAQYVPYEWPKNTRQHYIAMTQIWVGAEVEDVKGEIKKIVNVANGRLNPAGESWNFEPVPGYLNPESDQIAKSDEPETWPGYWPDKSSDEVDPGWQGSWNGYFGKNKFNADQEIYFKISDDYYSKPDFNYYPDSTDLTRGGLGILAGVRVMEWSQVLVEDVVFILYEIQNDGTEDLGKVAFCIWLADLVGGDGDSGDDSPDFDLQYNIAWCKDSDGIGNIEAFGSDPVGVAAIAYLETPGNSKDRIDNDGDGENNNPKVTDEMLKGEIPFNGIDDNENGIIDEDSTHIAFGTFSEGFGFADHIDNDGNGELESPVITQEMITDVQADKWRRWPPYPESDTLTPGVIHLIDVGSEDIGRKFADFIDNNDDGEDGNPVITQAMIETAALDTPYYRYKVPGAEIVLYDVKAEDLGLKYADGIDNNGNGAIDEGIDEGIDEMIDESREDYLDNDGDWSPFYDDVGLDGAELTGDPGEGDGKPTSGAGNSFPGEPNIDKTDVSESDQIGLTAVAYDRAGAINLSSDNTLWRKYLTPGKFWQPPPGGLSGDYDLFVTSGYFPLKSGQTERISMAVCLGADEDDAIRNKQIAQRTYDEDYQFAKQPIPPNVTAVARDGKVTIYWDDVAERSFDSYMFGIGSPGYDFEGYKIFKATDTGFKDAYLITDAVGTLTFHKPIFQCDLVDGIKGYHPVDINGVKYQLGDDTGITHSFVDTDVRNGQTYYYTVISYDFGGDVSNNIPPTECNIMLTINSATGDIEKKGPNVVVVTPEASAAGYVEADIVDIKLAQGMTTSKVGYQIVDPSEVLDDYTYRITFEDTLCLNQSLGLGYDTLKTKSYTLEDITYSAEPETLIDKSRQLQTDDEQPLIDGFQLILMNKDLIDVNYAESHWSSDSLWRFVTEVFRFPSPPTIGRPYPADYRIEFGAPEMDVSTDYWCGIRGLPFPLGHNFPPVPVDFTVKKKVAVTSVDVVDWVKIPFAFGDYSPRGYPDGILNADSVESDWVIFLDDTTENGDFIGTWRFSLDAPRPFEEYHIYQPQAGDTAFIVINKPFMSTDVFEFTTYASHIDTALAKKSLKKIKVVPNPYFAAASWESKNPYVSGRGPRAIHFNHLPAECTIRIYTVSGEMVKKIEHKTTYNDGSEVWDLLTRDNLSASYGVYIYHVDAPGIGEHVGKFAIIK
ncbi:MAG: hypothetical protein ISS29_09405 [Candidatus Marinimicrobia bacterium]|nr:hypothetical protein [Candidatus Neomarinimicrobiota bacterium]